MGNPGQQISRACRVNWGLVCHRGHSRTKSVPFRRKATIRGWASAFPWVRNARTPHEQFWHCSFHAVSIVHDNRRTWFRVALVSYTCFLSSLSPAEPSNIHSSQTQIKRAAPVPRERRTPRNSQKLHPACATSSPKLSETPENTRG